MDRNIRNYSLDWTSGQDNIAVSEAAPSGASAGIAIPGKLRWLDLAIVDTGTCTAYTATLWLYLGATRVWVSMTTDACARSIVLVSTTGALDALIGVNLDGAATRFDWVFTGVAGGAPTIDWDYRLG